MNKANLDRLIAHLREIPEERFDMDNFCGTACCIAGHAAFLATGRLLNAPDEVQDVATDWLDLGLDVAGILFVANWNRRHRLHEVSSAEAIQALEFVRDGAGADDLAFWEPNL